MKLTILDIETITKKMIEQHQKQQDEKVEICS